VCGQVKALDQEQDRLRGEEIDEVMTCETNPRSEFACTLNQRDETGKEEEIGEERG
jgi:hypothetical protein